MRQRATAPGPPWTRRAATSLLLGALLVPHPSAWSQEPRNELRGVVLDDRGEPLPFANVAIPALQRSMLTNAKGRFVVGDLPAGPLELRVRQIGFAPVVRTLATRAAGSAPADTIRLTRLPVLLEKVVVVSDPACTTGGFDAAQGSQVAAIFELARQNAEQYLLLARQYPVRYRLARTRRFLRADASVIAQNVDTVVQRSDERTPYAPGGVLRRKGGTATFHVPSAADVGEPAFQLAHCFRYAGIDTVAGRPVHRVDFVPTARVKTPDATGTLYLDATTGLLRRGYFRLVQLPARGLFFTAFDVTTTYREVQPFLLVPGAVSMAKVLHNVDFRGGEPIARDVEEWSLLDHAFIDATPNAEPAPR